MDGLILICALLVVMALTVWTLIVATLWTLERESQAAAGRRSGSLVRHAPLKG